MTLLRFGCVVEGDGEVRAVPLLVKRICFSIDPMLTVDVPRPVKMKRTRLDPRFGELERAIELAVGNIRNDGVLLILIDSDDDCPKTFAPPLLERVGKQRPGIPSGVVLAHHEFEAWFLAAAESLGGKRGLPDALIPPENPENISGCKEWLSAQMLRKRRYSETADQPALTQLFDMPLARTRSASFDKCYREIERLIRLYRDAHGEPPALEPPKG